MSIMGRKAIIFHGTGARPEWIWYPWLADRFRDRGYAVEVLEATGAAEGAGIVYAATRRETEEVAQALRERGVDAAAYHAGMGRKDRERVERDFMDDRVNTVDDASAMTMTG